MPFIPHTQADIDAMLASIGAPSIDALFDEIPAELMCAGLPGLPAGLSEMAVTRLARERAARDGFYTCFIGAGAYDHHIPAAVWQIVTRGEFYSAYTPYQAEASQGTLQLLYEFQSMMVGLTGLDIANASLYDGATALAEAVRRLHDMPGEQREAMGQAGRSAFLAHYTRARLVGRYEALLAEVTGSRVRDSA